jgi:hypothetical protein
MTTNVFDDSFKALTFTVATATRMIVALFDPSRLPSFEDFSKSFRTKQWPRQCLRGHR